jgi:3-deoxy-D-manno-octulosonate 8-phosphate phosphatase (KDO 8-P phosphatase)
MINQRLQSIQLLLLDVDGVMTDGRIIYDAEGNEIKSFNVKDGLGIRLLIEAGIQVGIITGRGSNALRHRCKNLGIDLLYEHTLDKKKVLFEILEKTHFSVNQVAFMGDDLPDIPLLKEVAVGISVANAASEVIAAADMVTHNPGGDGAVREICEAILKAKNQWDPVVQRFS